MLPTQCILGGAVSGLSQFSVYAVDSMWMDSDGKNKNKKIGLDSDGEKKKKKKKGPIHRTRR